MHVATYANADLIITRDNDLLVIEEYNSIRILKPRQFIDEFYPSPHPFDP